LLSPELLFEPFVEITLERVDRDAVLQHRVSMPDRDLLVFERLMIHGDTKWGSDSDCI